MDIVWGRMRRVVGDLRELMAVGTVAHGPKAARFCPPAIWAKAMAATVDQREKITRPLANHQYLIVIAYSLAGQAAAEEEKRIKEEGRFFSFSDLTEHEKRQRQVISCHGAEIREEYARRQRAGDAVEFKDIIAEFMRREGVGDHNTTHEE